MSIGEPMGTYPPFDRGQEADVWTKESDNETNAVSMVTFIITNLKRSRCKVKD